MARQSQTRICREGVYYTLVLLAVLFGAISRQLNLLILLGCVLAGPLVLSFVYGRLALRRLRVVRKPPPSLHADQRLYVDVAVTNTRRWLGAWTVEVQDVLAREGGDPAAAGTVSVYYPQIAGQETRQVFYEGWLPRRGRYRFGPLRVSTRFPLGLVRHSVTLDQSDVLLVHPKLGQLTHDWAKVMRENAAGLKRMHRRGVLEADFYGLRDWRAGDSRHWIHWRTSARRGSLVVRQFEQKRREDLALLVDLWQPANASDEQLEHVEAAVSFVATVIAQACRRPGHHLVLELAAQECLHRSGSASPVFFREQMEALAVAAPHDNSHFPPSLGHALSRVPPSMPTLIVSTRSVDWKALRAAAAERDVPMAGRHLQAVNVAGGELARYFQFLPGTF